MLLQIFYCFCSRMFVNLCIFCLNLISDSQNQRLVGVTSLFVHLALGIPFDLVGLMLLYHTTWYFLLSMSSIAAIVSMRKRPWCAPA